MAGIEEIENDDISPELKELLNYMKGAAAESDFTKRIEQAVQEAQEDPMWRKEYMMLSMKFQEKLDEGIEIGDERGFKRGIKQGVEQTILLLQEMIRSGRINEIETLSANEESLKKAIEEFSISEKIAGKEMKSEL